MNFCPGELFLKLLARIGEWHQNLSEKTVTLLFVKALTTPLMNTSSFHLEFQVSCGINYKKTLLLIKSQIKFSI